MQPIERPWGKFLEFNKKTDQQSNVDLRLQSVVDEQDDTADVDISATDNGYTAMVRAFSKAAYANKVDSAPEESDEDKKSEMEKSNEAILMDMLQDHYQEILRETRYLMADLNERLEECRSGKLDAQENLKGITNESNQALEDHKIITEQEAETEQEKEALLTKKEEVETKAADAIQDQTACTKGQQESCTITKDDPKVQELLEEGHDQKKAIAIVADTKVQEALAEQAHLDKQLQETEARLTRLSKGREKLEHRLQDLQTQAEVNQDKITRMEQIEKGLKARQTALEEFQTRTNDPAFKKAMAEGRVTKAQLDEMTPEFMRKDRNHGKTVSGLTAQPTQDNPTALAANTAKPAATEARTATSLASTLNDGGGIKAASLQAPFAAAANGAQPAEAVPMPPSPAIDQNRRMSANAAFG